jgi:hypothetical protein
MAQGHVEGSRHVAFGTPDLALPAVRFFCLGFAGTAQGATPQDTPGVTDLIRDRQDRLLEEQQRRLDELKDLPGKAAPASRRRPLTPVAPSKPSNSPAPTHCPASAPSAQTLHRPMPRRAAAQ